MHRRRQQGFTLLELLIAISIFALLSVMAYGALSSAVIQRKAGEQAADELKGLQTALLFIERDLQQAVDRPIRVGLNSEPALLFNDLLDKQLLLTHGGWSNPLGQPRSSLQRVAYRLDQGRLIRSSWSHLDRSSDEVAQEVTLLEGVDDFTLRFMDSQRRFYNNWPQRDPNGQVLEPLPIAVEVAFRKQGWGQFHRLITLPGAG